MPSSRFCWTHRRKSYQTRNHFGPEALEDTRIQSGPTVCAASGGAAWPDGCYLLILGERRCRASKLAGKTTIPAIVRRVSDQQAAEMTVVETCSGKT
jgi:ParB family chromosome partitioning protein